MGKEENCGLIIARCSGRYFCHSKDSDFGYNLEMPSDSSIPDPWQRYYDQRKDIDQTAFELGGRFDKLALAVAGGGFILSITFLEKISNSPPLWVSLLLVAAWLLFGASILFQLLALRYSQQAQQHKIRDLDLEFLHDRDESTREDFSDVEKTGKAIEKTQQSNDRGFQTMIVGLLCMVAFAACALLCKSSDEIVSYERKTETHTTTIRNPNSEKGRVHSPSTSRKSDKAR